MAKNTNNPLGTIPVMSISVGPEDVSEEFHQWLFEISDLRQGMYERGRHRMIYGSTLLNEEYPSHIEEEFKTKIPSTLLSQIDFLILKY